MKDLDHYALAVVASETFDDLVAPVASLAAALVTAAREHSPETRCDSPANFDACVFANLGMSMVMLVSAVTRNHPSLLAIGTDVLVARWTDQLRKVLDAQINALSKRPD